MPSQPLQSWRGVDGDVAGRPGVPLPPARMGPLRGGRPLKRWIWVGAFGPEAMLCAARARIGPAVVSWWAVWDRTAGVLAERTVRGRGGIEVAPGRVLVPGVMELEVGDARAVEVVSPHGSQYAWTRKRGGVRVRGWAAVEGRRLAVDAAGLVDESAGYHARHTAWRWSAGVGVAESGEPVAWNLVAGLHDAPGASERTVWVAGEPRAVGPVRFGADAPADPADPAEPAEPADPTYPAGPLTPADLATVSSPDGVSLRFTAEAARSRRERLLVISSDYEQPFGRFAGELPGVGRLREGWGVMERHDVRW